MDIICVGIGENEEESKKIKEATERKINKTNIELLKALVVYNFKKGK